MNTVAGWGDLNYDASNYPDILHEVDLPIYVTQADCARIYDLSPYVCFLIISVGCGARVGEKQARHGGRQKHALEWRKKYE